MKGDLVCKGSPVSGAEVVISYQAIRDNSAVIFVSVQTNAQGHYSTTITDLDASSIFDAGWRGNDACPNGANAARTVRALVRVGIIFNPNVSHAARGQSVLFTGRVLPEHAGDKVYLMLLHGDTRRWEIVATSRLGLNSNYRFKYKKGSNTVLYFRIAFPTQDTDHLWNVSMYKHVD
ncbi:MAG: hypothetical protein NVSMB57_01070 [Actinomycetota bacterium]